MRILALVWRYRPESVWDWLNENYLDKGEIRREQFNKWVEELISLDETLQRDRWPAWVSPQALMAMLPDFFTFFPPDTDPSIDEFNRDIPDIRHRWHSGHLRSDAMAKIAESGSQEAGNFLAEWAADPKRHLYRDNILFYLDRWHRASSEKGWEPLSPQNLLGVLTQGLRPVRNHSELFSLVSEMIEDIKAEMEGGQQNLKRLCWLDPTGPEPKPADETVLQIVLNNQMVSHQTRSKIVGNREIKVTDEKRPDLKIETQLEAGQSAVIFIEVKRQLHRDIFTGIEQQLANKYLIVPEARHGIYFVGWYGDSVEFWRASQKARKKYCGSKPRTAADLEKCLQRQADLIVKNRKDIDSIKVAVVDLSLGENQHAYQ